MKYTFVTQKQLDEKLKAIDQNIKRGEILGLFYSYCYYLDLLDYATVYFDALLAHKNGASIKIDQDFAITPIKAAANEAELSINQLLSTEQYSSKIHLLRQRATAYAFQGKFAEAEHDLEEAESLVIEEYDRRRLRYSKGLIDEIKIQPGKFNDDMEAQKEKTIDKNNLSRIVNHYQTQSWFYFFFSWLGLNDKRSATIGALFVLANDPQTPMLITLPQVEQAIKSEKNQDTLVHRLSLFQGSSREQKNGTSTDDIISELRDEFNRTSPK